jgi:hypothetical protein
MRSIIELKPERLVIAGCLIRPTFAYPGGPAEGFIVTRGKRLIVHVHIDAGYAAALAAAKRFARGCPTRRDEMFSVTWADSFGTRRPDWLVFIGRTPVTGTYRRRDGRFVFHRRCGIPARSATFY